MIKSDYCQITKTGLVDSPSLYDAALIAVNKAQDKSVATQKRYVKKLVGAEFFNQCLYDEITNRWSICGYQFQCFGSSHLAWGSNGSVMYYVQTLTDLGRFLRGREREKAAAKAVNVANAAAAVVDEMRKVNKPVGNKPSSSGPFSLWHRIRGN